MNDAHRYSHRYSPPPIGEGKAELLKPDWYDFEIVDAWETDKEGEPLITRNGDNFMRMRVLELSSGTVLWHYLFFSEQGAARINSLLFATGAKANEGDELVIKADDFLGKVFSGKVILQERNGETFNNIVKVRPPEAAREITPEPDEEVTETPLKPADIEDDAIPF